MEVHLINSYGEDPFISTGKAFGPIIRQKKSNTVNAKTKRKKILI